VSVRLCKSDIFLASFLQNSVTVSFCHKLPLQILCGVTPLHTHTISYNPLFTLWLYSLQLQLHSTHILFSSLWRTNPFYVPTYVSTKPFLSNRMVMKVSLWLHKKFHSIINWNFLWSHCLLHYVQILRSHRGNPSIVWSFLLGWGIYGTIQHENLR